MISRLIYYLSSIPTLLTQVKNWPEIVLVPFRREPTPIKLRDGSVIKARNLMDVWVVKETCLDNDYETHGTALKDGWIVIDIGAGIGEFTVVAARNRPQSRVYAYEPFPESFALLEENLALNQLKNVRPFPIAIGAASEKFVLETTGSAVQHTVTGSEISGRATSKIEVEGLSLDDLFAINQIERCDFLKVDCEGAEFDIFLHTSQETLDKITHICLEYHNGFTSYSHTDLVGFLQKAGFKTEITPNPVHDFLGFLYAYR